jgi:hypothetical protein
MYIPVCKCLKLFLYYKLCIPVGVNRDLIDSLLIARQEAENEGDEAALEKLEDTYLIQTISDIFMGTTPLFLSLAPVKLNM